jgi:hypothetical protein
MPYNGRMTGADVQGSRPWTATALDRSQMRELGRAIDELAYVLSTDRLSTRDKIGLLEQWRYDAVLLQVGASEGFGCAQTDTDSALLQQISKVLLRLSTDA